MIGKRKATVLDQIREIDAQLLVAGPRLIRERVSGTVEGYAVQRGVCDRMLDARLVLMRERDAQAAAS